jgi:hypothetical protein
MGRALEAKSAALLLADRATRLYVPSSTPRRR